ncbi:hypothetical protein FNJ84_06420 [Paracoccus sp. M683]|uniref:hypothetical protein n=1 Tax=Paracoccus sp. M683 TaxID=2594268 RepID=UPI0011812F91|nr:hypothetical protein [Paracoccus sp. M683]TRW98406.1 hypothetical protein FNJ84_06420 [Paracoccus sp. M683]
MRDIRHIILSLLLILAVLPWGAYARASGMAAAVGASVAMRGAGQAVTYVQPAPAKPRPVFVAPPRRCHGPAIPGFICLGDGLVLGGAVVTARHVTAAPFRPGADWQGREVSVSAMLDPPIRG